MEASRLPNSTRPPSSAVAQCGFFTYRHNVTIVGRVTDVPGEPLAVNGFDVNRVIRDRAREIAQQRAAAAGNAGTETAGGDVRPVELDCGVVCVNVEFLEGT